MRRDNDCPVQHWARLTPTRPAIVGPEGMLDYRTLDRCLHGLQRQLVEAGLRAGDRLAAPVRDGLHGVLLAWACIRAGLVFCPLNPAVPPARLAELARQLRVAAFCSPAPAPVGPWRWLRLDFSRLERGPAISLAPRRLCNLILTSGSGGRPKAVAHRLDNHLASARGSAARLPLADDSGWLLSLPLFHVGGYAILFRVFLAGAILVLEQRERPLAERLRTQPITHLSLVPTQLWRLLAAGFDPAGSRLQALLLGGAAIPRTLVRQLGERGMVPWVSYGLSEMSSQVCTGRAEADGSLGRPLPGRELRLVNGEIQVRGETLCDGYFQAGRVEPVVNREGWFATRDLGRLTGDGRLRLVGRSDNLFISGGENIQPEAIEQRLLEHPAVVQALVVPVCHPEWGQRPVCFIDRHGGSVAAPELADWLREQLPGFMVPDAWLPWPAQTGLKPARRQLARLAADLLAQ